MPANLHARRQSGFTLIELLIVLVVMTIIAAIAIPSYSRHAYRARRIDAKEALIRIANAQERHYVAHHHYGSLDELGVTDVASTHRHYILSMAFTDANRLDYHVKATPVGRQARDVCGELSLDNTGRRLPMPDQTPGDRNGHCW